MYNINVGLAEIGKKKKWLLEELAKKDINVKPSALSNYVSGYRSPENPRIMPAIIEIINTERRTKKAKELRKWTK